MPTRCGPSGPSLRLYDRYRFGDLAELFTLDDRQYRAHHACRATLTRGKPLENCAERLDPMRTMLGAEQEAWFASGMAKRLGALEPARPADADGRARPRSRRTARLLGRRLGRLSRSDDSACSNAVAASPVKDTLVLGGDVHSFWAADLKRTSPSRSRRTVATEFVGGSITSQGPTDERVQQGLRARTRTSATACGGVYGYGMVALDAKQALVSFRTVTDVRDPKSGIADGQALRRRSRQARRADGLADGSSDRRASRRSAVMSRASVGRVALAEETLHASSRRQGRRCRARAAPGSGGRNRRTCQTAGSRPRARSPRRRRPTRSMPGPMRRPAGQGIEAIERVPSCARVQAGRRAR